MTRSDEVIQHERVRCGRFPCFEYCKTLLEQARLLPPNGLFLAAKRDATWKKTKPKTGKGKNHTSRLLGGQVHALAVTE